jgi:ribosome-associated heat shock protein Hsp15
VISLQQRAAPRVTIEAMDGARVDRWLWAVRLVKTRSLAAQACRAGHVQINGVRAKPSSAVKVGDTVRARLGGRERIVEVARLLETRVGAELAAACLVDRSPPPPPRDPLAVVGPRPPGVGRPTKRERRRLDQARGRRA